MTVVKTTVITTSTLSTSDGTTETTKTTTNTVETESSDKPKEVETTTTEETTVVNGTTTAEEETKEETDKVSFFPILARFVCKSNFFSWFLVIRFSDLYVKINILAVWPILLGFALCFMRGAQTKLWNVRTDYCWSITECFILFNTNKT